MADLTNVRSLLEIIIWILVGCLVFWLAVWTVGVLELPNTPRRIVLALVGILAIIVVLNRMGVLA